MRLALTAAAASAVVALSASAQAALQVQTGVSSQRVGVGETFVVQLTVTSDGQNNAISDARLPVPPGMTASRPNASPQSRVSIINGQMTQSSGVTVNWVVTATKAGSFRVGPPSITFAGERAQGNPIPIEVVNGSTGGGQRARRSADPFDFMNQFGFGNSPFPPGFNFKSPFDDDSSEQQEQEPSYPEELRLDKAPDAIAFARATVTPDHVYVGQQVNLKVFAYGGRGEYSLGNLNEPSHADFLAFDATPDQFRAYLVPVGGTRYIAGKLRELPLFPLHAGTLRAGDMKMGFSGRGYPPSGPNLGLLRESNWADVIVSEPPLRNRPPGYKIGDVGEYTLTANVEPREIMAGEAVSVIATLSGVGNVPFKIQTPEHQGVEWLEPSLTEKIEVPNGVVQGSRTFSYVVKVSEPGKLDLGEVTLPYFNPKHRDYAIARGALGSINVKPNPNAKSAAVEAKPDDHLANILKPRDALGSYPALQKPLADGWGFWAGLFFAPFGMVLAGGIVSATARAREKMRERGSSLSAQLDAALREARELAKTDTPGSVNAVERAVFLAIELKLGLKARAILKAELASALTDRGLPAARAQALAAILEDCDALRFVGAASGVAPAELAQRAAKNAAEMRVDKLAASS
ncbi:MAG TPA: BatD family protein [Polyangiaceae bacterium]